MTDQPTLTAAAHSFGIKIEEAGSSRFTASAPASVTSAQGVMSTAKSRTGGTLAREPGPADLVEVQGMTLPLEAAARHGFVKRTDDGRFVDVDAADLAKATAPEAKDEETPDVSEALDYAPEEASAISDASALIQEAGGNPAAVIGEFLNDPDSTPATFLAAARAKGMSDADAQAQVRAVAEVVDGAVGRYVIAAGLSSEQLPAFYEYVKAKVSRSEYAGAIAQALYAGDASPFKSYVARFRGAHGSGRGSAGKVQRVKVGAAEVDTVHVPGVGRVSVEAARRAGLV